MIWRGLDAWRAEAAWVRLDDDRLTAHGTQLGAEPEPYRLEYTLHTGADFVTETLELSLLREGSPRRRLLVRRPSRGTS